MSMSRPGVVPKVPTLPAGDEVAAYATYLEAQKAVDYLSDNKFPVENVTIVGTDLRMVERVTGRLTYGRVALAGALSGAWFGFFVGLLITLFAGEAGFQVMFAGIALGAGFGLLFSVLSYAFTRGRRDFTSSSQIVAATYAILCGHEHASDARSLLVRSPVGPGKPRGTASAGAPSPAAPYVPVAQPPAAGPATGAGPGTGAGPDAGAAPDEGAARPARPTDPRWVTPSGQPRYGAMRPDAGAGAGAGAAGAAPDAQPDAGASADRPVAEPNPTGTQDRQTSTDEATGTSGAAGPEDAVTPDDAPPTPPANPYAPPTDDRR